MPRQKVYGWNAAKLATAYSMKELHTLRQSVESDPESLNPAHPNDGSIWIYNAKARKKLDAIAWALTYKIMDAKAKASA